MIMLYSEIVNLCSSMIVFTKIDLFLSGRVTGHVTKFTVRKQILMGLRVISNILLDIGYTVRLFKIFNKNKSL